MKHFTWLEDYRSQLNAHDVRATGDGTDEVQGVVTMEIAPQDWAAAARASAAQGLRFAGLWGDPVAETLVFRACFEFAGDYLLLSTRLPPADASLPSIASSFSAAGRLERHARDLLGCALPGSPDERRWTRHQAWSEEQFPLRNDFPKSGSPPRHTRSDADYPFQPVRGSGVYEIPVGPVHAGIIEPGHFRFHAVGEDILRLEERLAYVHKGIEKIAVGRTPAALARLAGRVSGDSTVAHTWAACQAMERATHCRVPARAQHLRAVLCERERIANHLGDIGAICNDVGFPFAHVQCARLREQWQRQNGELFGHRLLMDAIVPGGVATDVSSQQVAQQREAQDRLRAAIVPLFDIIGDHPSLEDRLLGAGILTSADARALGCTGFVGKASGQAFDVRADAAYPPYDQIEVPVPVFTEGDVAARVRVRMSEIRASLDLLHGLLDRLPEGDIETPLPSPAAAAAGLGAVDGWRGEIITFVRLDTTGCVSRYFPRDPSWFTWPALERLIHGNIVPDFPVCNKSVNASYSGQDL